MRFSRENAEAIGKTVSDLVAIKSLSGDEAPMAEHIEKLLAEMGIPCSRDTHDNLLAVIEPQNPGAPADTLHLSGHTDTVVPVEGWATDPWSPILSGNGRRAKDHGIGHVGYEVRTGGHAASRAGTFQSRKIT